MLLWVLISTILFPAYRTLLTSLTDGDTLTLNHYLDFLSGSTNLQTLLNSIILGLLTVLFCGLVGTALAFLVHYFELPYKKLIDKILILPIMLPGLIIVFAFVQLYGESGIITQSIKLVLGLEDIPFHFKGLGGILFVHTYTQYVYFYLNVSIAIRQLDQSVIEASQNLGASKWLVFKTVLLPFLKPAIIASSIVTFMSGIGSFSAPSIIGGNYRVMTVQILMSKANNYMSVAAMQVVLLSVASLSFLWVLKQYEKKIQFTGSVRGSTFKPVVLKSAKYRWLQKGILTLLCLLIIMPVLMILVGSFVKSGTWMVEIFPREFSFENYVKVFMKSRAFAPFKNSVLMALTASAMVLIIGLPASAIITKTHYRSKFLIEFLVMLPWTMPASAIAINTINAYNKPSLFSFNQVLVGSYILLPIAYFVSAIPIMVRTLNVSMSGLNDTYLEASQSLGANRLLTLKNIAIPIVSPGIIAGFLLVFIRSIGEYTMSAFLYTVSNKPISIAMVNSIFEYDIGLAMTYGSLLVVLSTVLSSLVYWILPQGEKKI
jgi:iron(III) transport system permease protein